MKITFLLTAIICSYSLAYGQFNYDLNVSQATYTPLTGATNVNATTIWDEEDYGVPIGFQFKVGTQISNTFYHIIDGSFAVDTTGVHNVFVVTDLDLHDRGNAGGSQSVSPIQYKVDGSAPNRIFKYEIANAGIFEEYDLYTTNNDSVNIQIWLYEGSNIIEYHYGISNITHPSDYYYLGNGKPVVGFVKNFNNSTGQTDNFYYLKGSTSAPNIDSTNSYLNPNISSALSTYPPNGTVYRFTPKPTMIENVDLKDNLFKVYPNPVKELLTIAINESKNVEFKVIVADISGKVVYSDEKAVFTNSKYSLNTKALVAGSYFLTLKNSSGKNHTKKFIKVE